MHYRRNATFKNSLLFIFIAVLFIVATSHTKAQTREIDWEVHWCNDNSLNTIFPSLKGSIQKPTDFNSTSVGETVGYTIYLPPSYYTSNKEYPVIYFLHGSLGNECNYVSTKNAGGTVNSVIRLVEDGKIPETIFVAPNGGALSFYKGVSETMIINELIPFIDDKYRTISNRSGRGLEGFSMGGFGTTQFGFKYPEMFCSIVPMAGGNLDNFNSNISSIKANNLKVRYVTGALDQSIGINQGYNVIVDTLVAEGIMKSSDAIKVPGVSHDLSGLIEVEGLRNAQFHWSCFGGGSPVPTVTASPTPAISATATPRITTTVSPTSSTSLVGDLNNDLVVNERDYTLFLGHYGETRCFAIGDFDSNCVVDLFDLNLLVESSRASSVSPTPAPTGIGGGIPSPTPGSKPIEPYAAAPACSDIGVIHDNRAWHGLWNYEYGCHWDHEHKQNPHDMDYLFGSDIYSWFGTDENRLAEISYPWQTFMGAGANFEVLAPGAHTENHAKHQGYNWLYFRDKTDQDHISGALLLGSQVITDARVIYHQIGGQMGALTRFHSTYLQARACAPGIIVNSSQGAVTSGCGTFSGGGWLDFGRLNFPERGIYAPLPGDPPAFGNVALGGRPEAAPYRIHPLGQNSLDSWQSEGNTFNYLPSDPKGETRLRVGLGVHFDQGESTGETDPTQFGKTNPSIHFWCVDPVTKLITCDNNNSAAALFRTWVTIPRSLDGSIYDTDGSKNGFFSFNGYTNRYGDIVGGCSKPGLDCVPTVSNHFPVGDCNDTACKAAYRGDLQSDLYEADVAESLGVSWIKYPN